MSKSHEIFIKTLKKKQSLWNKDLKVDLKFEGDSVLFHQLKFRKNRMCQKKHLRGLIHYSNDSHADRRKGLINYAYQEKKLPLLMGLFVISRIGLIINDMGYIIKKNHKVHKLKGSLALKMANFFPSTIKIVDHISHDKQNVSLIN